LTAASPYLRLCRVVGCLRCGAWTFQLDYAKRDQMPFESTDRARRSAQTTDNTAKLQTTRRSRS
jgi:hypothetical protein